MTTNHRHEEDDQSNYSPYCPSFNTYTINNRMAEIAIRVADADSPSELRAGPEVNQTDGDLYNHSDEDEDDFEFDLAGAMISEKLPLYPVFDRDLLRDLGLKEETTAAKIQLRSLFFEEDYREPPQSRLSPASGCSEELIGVSPETYCSWAPKSQSPSPSRCMKSSSTGSGPAPAVSKTWRLRNLLRRCKSDGKEGLMLVTSKKSKDKTGSQKPPSPEASPGGYYGSGSNNKEMGTRRRSYLPYKQDLLGFFGSPQSLRKIKIPPF